MKKLNNRGFGFGTMIGFLSFFCILIIIIALMASQGVLNENTLPIEEESEVAINL